MPKMTEKRKKHIYAIGISIVIISELILRVGYMPVARSGRQIAIMMSVEWSLMFLMVLVWIPKVEKLGLKSIGFGRFKLRHIFSGILMYLLTRGFKQLFGFTVRAFGWENLRQHVDVMNEYSLIIIFFMFLSGTVLEEVYYRGYFLERIPALTGKKWIAGAVSVSLFALAHLFFFGWATCINAGVFSLAMVVLYYKEKSIWPCIIAHGINDYIGFLQLLN